MPGAISSRPSLYDNAPLVVREAAAFKTPAVLIKGCTAAEVIKDGENGYLCENDREAFAQRIVQALGDDEKHRKIAENAQRTLCRTWKDVVSEVKDRYLKILDRWER